MGSTEKPEPPVAAAAPAARNIGIDLARGVAVVLMIQTHALDGWASPAAKTGWGYALSRAFANIPAPLFLLLAGIGLCFGYNPARGAATGRLARRALQVVGYGYLVSLIYTLIEGRLDPKALLRADILHCIGLSLLLCTWLLVGRSHLGLRAAALSLAALLTGLAAGRWLPPLPDWLAVPTALLVDVPGYTRFPLFPLCGFTAVGVAVGAAMKRRSPTVGFGLVGLLLLVALVPVWQKLTGVTLALLGGKLSRSHPAVVWNFLEGCTRALAVLLGSLAVAGLLARQKASEHPAVTWLVRLGRGSLLAYAVHIPLCYGRLARPLAHQLEMPLATLLVAVLTAFTYCVILARDHIKARQRPS
ncbi:MAG TPA: heparan-alpha-glucosaminide N-acetyltransferase domain-containing protein [Pseudomonadota bacterium]|nr:heparan-alpha-glucosaminide N-acetyltransferase domain-containing protein [Pseudomonadota bacterium]